MVTPAGTAAPSSGKTLADVLKDAKVQRCPACQSEGVASPSDYAILQGRLVLTDSQTYHGHWWYADTGELLQAAPPAAAAIGSSSATPAARSAPGT